MQTYPDLVEAPSQVTNIQGAARDSAPLAVALQTITNDRLAPCDALPQPFELYVTRISTVEELQALAPEWHALDAAMFPRVPFTAPEWNLLWWKHFRRDRLLYHDVLNAFAVRDLFGTLIAVAPMMISSRPGSGPLRIRELQFFGADTNVTELRGIICRPDDMPCVTRALRQAFAMQKGDWDWIQWRGLRVTGAPSDWQQDLPALKPMGIVPNYYLVLPATWDVFKAGLPRNTKEALRKCYNSLARDGFSFSFEAVSSPAEIPAAIDRFLTLHTQRADMTGSIHHPDCFAAPTAQAFLREHAAGMAGVGALRVFELRIGDAVVATRVAFLLGSEIYLYYSGYDLAWKKYSVMTTLVAEALKWAIANGVTIANLSIGTDVSKTRWRPEVAHRVDGFEVAPSLRAALAFKVASRLRRAVKGSIAQGPASEAPLEAKHVPT